MEQATSKSVVRVTRRAADRLRAGHLWVYRTDVESQSEMLEAGAVVTVVDGRGLALGSAVYSSASQIAARIVSRVPGLTREQYVQDVCAKVEVALARRWLLAPVSERDNAHRLIFSEADELPGIVADRYNDLVLLQLLTQGTAQDDVRAALVEVLRKEFAGAELTVWERPDARVRELEQLTAPAAGALFASGEAKAKTEFMLNGLRFEYDAGAGQKTGAFLDQRLNYAAAARWVEASGKASKALDVCTYQGGFALHLAQVCERVTGVDASRAALEAADRNLERNPQLRAETDWIEADAFELMRAYDDAARTDATRKYDAIVLDPPAFAKSRRAAEGALRGYKELNLRALRLLNAGGTLVTCSCSHHVSLADFTEVVGAAANDAGRRVQLLETRAAASDHPEVLTLPETRYLKCLILRVD
ncbi:MAG: class I SAM-dependent rRNA methyltransferase [Acidobacteriota bacterium]|nr:class I SAM-dependent rRNA methyltransferase [Acidobacteriota bacterium]